MELRRNQKMVFMDFALGLPSPRWSGAGNKGAVKNLD